MLNDFSQTGADRREKVIQTQMGDHRVVHFQQKTHPVPFVCQLLLGRSSALVMQHVVYRDRNLLRHLLYEADLCFLIDAPAGAAESHRAETAQCRGQWDHVVELHVVFCNSGINLGNRVSTAALSTSIIKGC